MNTPEPERQQIPPAVSAYVIREVRKNLHNGPCDSRRWSKQQRYDEYRKLAKLESELHVLYNATHTLGKILHKHAAEESDIIATWYHGGLRDRVIDLVGHDALLARHESLKTSRAYDIVYQTLVDLLYEPDMFDDVDKPEGKLRWLRASDLTGPIVRSHRDGDNLVLTDWFNESAH